MVTENRYDSAVFELDPDPANVNHDSGCNCICIYLRESPIEHNEIYLWVNIHEIVLYILFRTSRISESWIT